MASSARTKSLPPYCKRAGFFPSSTKDFGDGGAFPEIRIMQYPLGLGHQYSLWTDDPWCNGSGNSAKTVVNSHNCSDTVLIGTSAGTLRVSRRVRVARCGDCKPYLKDEKLDKLKELRVDDGDVVDKPEDDQFGLEQYLAELKKKKEW